MHFCGEWAETDAGENFLLVEDCQGDSKIVIFSTEHNLELLAQAEKIYVDGTFQICPRVFYQIFSLHAFKNGRQFPLVYCLLPRKSRTVYLRALELIKQKSEDLGHTLAPVEVLTDFELAIIQAVELTFPTTEVKGCFFHFAQALSRKISILGLQPAYRQNQDVSKFVRQTVALAFVPRRFVHLAWQAIKVTAPAIDKMDEFVAYFEETWLVGNFALQVWNVFSTDSSSPRTNNHLKGWHNKLKRIARKAHPNVFELVEIFKQEQSEVSIAELDTGSQPPKRAKKSVDKDKKIGKLKSRFSQNEITLEEYVRRISAHTAFYTYQKLSADFMPTKLTYM